MPARIFCLCLLLLFTLPALSARYYYTGTLGARDVQVDLTFEQRGVELEPKIKPGEIYGHFQYADGAWHWLSGTVRNGRVVLYEDPMLSEQPQHLSTFTGQLTADRKGFTGSWVDAAGKNTQRVTLTAVAEYRAMRRPHQRKLLLTGVYPVFYHATPGLRALERQLCARIDTALTQFATEYRDAHSAGYPLDYYRDYAVNIAYYSPRLVSARIDDDTFTGGAHGYEDTKAANYYMTPTEPHLLGLHDIFRRDSRYMDALFDLVLADLERQHCDWLWIDELSPKIMGVYTISKAGITFIFPPYVVSGYGQGTFNSMVPFGAFHGYFAHTDVTALLQTMHDEQPVSSAVNTIGDADAPDYILTHIRSAWEAATLPPARRDIYLQATNIFSRVTAARTVLNDAVDGKSFSPVNGYTLNQPMQAETLAAIVKALRMPVADPAARERAHTKLAHSEQLAKELLTPQQAPKDRPAYANASRQLLYALADLTLATPSWPDTVAVLACGYVEQTLAPTAQSPNTPTK